MLPILSNWTTLVFSLLSAQLASAFLVIEQPAAGTEWVNNVANPVSWIKGVRDGLNGFDVELARLRTDGLQLAARNVPANLKRFHVLLLDVPPGDDYFLIFINSTHGVMHATSARFNILASSSLTPSTTIARTDPNIPTITISGSPHPTKDFQTTFPAIQNGAVSIVPGSSASQLAAMLLLTLSASVGGAFWTLAS